MKRALLLLLLVACDDDCPPAPPDASLPACADVCVDVSWTCNPDGCTCDVASVVIRCEP